MILSPFRKLYQKHPPGVRLLSPIILFALWIPPAFVLNVFDFGRLEDPFLFLLILVLARVSFVLMLLFGSQVSGFLRFIPIYDATSKRTLARAEKIMKVKTDG